MVREVLASTRLCSLVSTVGRLLHVAWLVTDSQVGCAMIIARSFARIHETNLKVWFPSPATLYTYERTLVFTEAGSLALVVRR